ncbi:LOW QUALITY PROTEIN: hypothetical protein CVT25_010881 [Psilocybe cyanescens]|uniref:Uncharacterized protein n=1 Tax=Psilocybe cyanescens TaxID=93625 RepID=A0A409WFK1_PSICY|nr:LOW QUALITY PROTEIN: hypothetical protein CVT25_010881 [Psilocybe cyanescens]
MSQAFNDTIESVSSRLQHSLGLSNVITLLFLGLGAAIAIFYKPLQVVRSYVSTANGGHKQVRNDATEPDPNKHRQFGGECAFSGKITGLLSDLLIDVQILEWNPVNFRYPAIEACLEKLTERKPIPYRPFRWGAYHVNMGIRNMPWNDWIELDKDHGSYHRIKTHRVKTRGQAAVRVLSDQANPGIVKGGAEAAVELVHELAEYLCRRYPSYFEAVRYPERLIDPDRAFCDWGWKDLPAIRTVRITSLNVSYDLPLSTDDGDRAPERAMEIAGLMIQDDLALMIEGVDGKYYFQAGSICLPVSSSIASLPALVSSCNNLYRMGYFVTDSHISPDPGFWRMNDKIGLRLDDIHITGNVPQYKERLDISLERFFRRLPVDKPVVRNNYFFQTNRQDEVKEDSVDPEELAWAESTVGPEDAYEHGTAFKMIQTESKRNGTEQETIATKVECIRFRSERQTLRRLPRSGAVVFTIRTYLTPVSLLAREKGVPGRMASALRSWPEDVGEYKGKYRGGWFEPLLKYLDECEEVQGPSGAEGRTKLSCRVVENDHLSEWKAVGRCKI